MYLKPRLRAVANLVPECEKFADIGTDHAYIPIAMIKENKAKNAIASDIGEGPLMHAQKNIQNEKLENKIETRIGAGLIPIKINEINGAVIAGMGGKMIRKILEENIEKSNSIEWFVLQPMKNSDELRKWLVSNGYKICKESLAKEDWHIYEIIQVRHGTMKIEDELKYEIGITEELQNHVLYKDFLKKKIFKRKRLLSMIDINTENVEQHKKREKAEIELKRMEEILCKLQ